jgi:DNA processing protein
LESPANADLFPFDPAGDSPPVSGASDEFAALQLSLVRGVGPLTWQRLFDAFGSAQAILNAEANVLQMVEGVGPKLAAAIRAGRDPAAANRELAECRRRGIGVRIRGHSGYPASLERIPDPPTVLYQQGEYLARDEVAVAIVGSRRCTVYGRQTAERLGGALARAGFTVVSGLARGIDGAAHRGALDAGGRTIAVLGTGLDEIYPPEHADLASNVAASGAIFSECPLGSPPTPGMFPQRNRIISGLSLCVILVEAARGSGALHTARHAMEQNREVFAVPGRIDSPTSAGCHDLIRDGATLLRAADDVIESLGPLTRPVGVAPGTTVHAPRELQLNEQETAVLNLVGSDPTPVDDILRGCPIEPHRVLATLTILEMKRLVRRVSGNQVCRP